jgi:hypothetical protein
MMDTLLAAGGRLADALLAENEALARLDLPGAAGLSGAKMRAADAFAAAFAAASKVGARPEGAAQREGARDMAARLETLGAENKRLLQRAVSVQSRVIETIAGPALPRAANPVYGAAGRRPAAPRGAAAPGMALALRA